MKTSGCDRYSVGAYVNGKPIRNGGAQVDIEPELDQLSDDGRRLNMRNSEGLKQCNINIKRQT